jgi:hypothetical protein
MIHALIWSAFNDVVQTLKKLLTTHDKFRFLSVPGSAG